MASNLAHPPLVTIAMPQSGIARFVVQAVLVVAGSLLLALSAKAKVVLGPVDMSLQTLVVLLIGATFGLRMGVATLAALPRRRGRGLAGVPGHARKGHRPGLYGRARPAATSPASWSWPRSSAGPSIAAGARNIVKIFAAMLVAEIVMMAMGFSWLAVLIGAAKSWQFGVVPFIVPDLIKVALAVALTVAATGVASSVGRTQR